MYDDDPEHKEYDDDEYNHYPQEYNEHGFPKDFKVNWKAWESWLSKAIKEIVEEDENIWVFGYENKQPKKFPVSDGLPKGAWGDKYFAYLGSNHYEEEIWKRKYFVIDKIEIEWKQHIRENAVHFLKNPSYYKGLHDILN